MPSREQHEFIPAFFVDIVQKGETFPRGEWPLHLTLFPPIQAPYRSYYGDKLRSVVNVLSPFDITVGEDDMFGPDHDVPVKHIEEAPRLQVIHMALVRTLASLMHDPTYRQPYNPHITVQSGAMIETGETIRIGGFSVVEKTDDKWTVVDKIGLWGAGNVE